MRVETLTSSDFEIKARTPKILLFDIETAACEGKFWRSPWQTNIIRIINDTHMISWSAKWLGGKQITRALPDYEGYTPGSRDDKALVTELHELLEKADLVIAHHGDKFDIPYSNGRFVVNGLLPTRKYKSYDTRAAAKRRFGFTSNKLDDIARSLGIGTKIPIHYEIWEGCERGDTKAWNIMRKYNAHDVKLLEEVYLKFRAWDQTHPNLAVIKNTGTECCPSCGQSEVRKRGWNYTPTGRRQEYSCNNCGRRFSGRHQKVTDYR